MDGWNWVRVRRDCIGLCYREGLLRIWSWGIVLKRLLGFVGRIGGFWVVVGRVWGSEG